MSEIGTERLLYSNQVSSCTFGIEEYIMPKIHTFDARYDIASLPVPTIDFRGRDGNA